MGPAHIFVGIYDVVRRSGVGEQGSDVTHLGTVSMNAACRHQVCVSNPVRLCSVRHVLSDSGHRDCIHFRTVIEVRVILQSTCLYLYGADFLHRRCFTIEVSRLRENVFSRHGIITRRQCEDEYVSRTLYCWA